MAIMQAGILGTTTGKVGGVVGSTWKNKNTMRAYRATIATSQTAAAVNSRSAFKKGMALTQQIGGVLARPLWQRFEKSMSGFNALMSSVRKSFDLAGAFHSDLLYTSKGKIEPTDITEIIELTNSVSITYPTTTKGYQLAADVPFLTVVNATGTKAVAFDGRDGSFSRSGGIFVSGDIPFLAEGAYNCYLSFMRADGSMVSDSTFLEN